MFCIAKIHNQRKNLITTQINKRKKSQNNITCKKKSKHKTIKQSNYKNKEKKGKQYDIRG